MLRRATAVAGLVLAFVAVYGLIRRIVSESPREVRAPMQNRSNWAIRDGAEDAGSVDLLVDDVECVCDDKGVVSVTGALTNVSGTALRHAEVEVKFYSESGDQVGSALTITNALAQGASWRFRALCPGNDATRYDIVRVAAS